MRNWGRTAHFEWGVGNSFDNVTPDAILSTVLGRVPVPVVPLREQSNVRVSA